MKALKCLAVILAVTGLLAVSVDAAPKVATEMSLYRDLPTDARTGIPGARDLGNNCGDVFDAGILGGGNTTIAVSTIGFTDDFTVSNGGTCGWAAYSDGYEDGILTFQVAVAGTWHFATCDGDDNTMELRSTAPCPGTTLIYVDDDSCPGPVGNCAAPYGAFVTADLVPGVDYYIILDYYDGDLVASGPCAVDADCDNGLFCDGVETCVDEACVPGPGSPCEWYQKCDDDTDTCPDPDNCVSFRTDDTAPGSFAPQNFNAGCYGILAGDDIQLSDHAGKALVSYQFYTQARNLFGNPGCAPAGCGDEPEGTPYTVYADLWTVIGSEDPANCGLPGAPIPGTHCEMSPGTVMPGGSPADLVLCDAAAGVVPGTILPEGDDYWNYGVDVWLVMTTSNDGAGFSITYGAPSTPTSPGLGEDIGGPLPKPAGAFPYFFAGMDDEWSIWYAGTGLEGIVMIGNCDWEAGSPTYGQPIPLPGGAGFSLFGWSDNDFRGVEFCTTPVGQCCYPDGTCAMVEVETDCTDAGGAYTLSTVADPHACSDLDGDGIDDSVTCGEPDNCPGVPNPGQEDCNADGEGDACELDPEEQDPDGDGFCSGDEECDDDPLKQVPGQCGCGIPDTDTDSDGVADCNDNCMFDPLKTEPGQCGCGNPDTDSDGDGIADCVECAPGVDDAVFCPGCVYPDCGDAIPTVSEWGLVILALLLLVAGKVYFGRRTAKA